ncbi:MAG: peptidoglycan glycosyltransferase [Chitinophaga sp.]|jgi:cell division protein FtsI (penicillin-binding protein 3)|nr:peptidoglycan glycosyltransferase [Chitinophaga sp.]
MDVKRDILWRVYLSYILVAVVGIFIIGKAAYIQQVQGSHWRSMSDSLHERIQEIDAERGTIFSEDGQMLSTSIPQFDVLIDFAADGLREKNGKRFKENIDSLSLCLANLFKDNSAATYKKILQEGYNTKDRNFLLRKKITYVAYQEINKFPLVRQGKYKSGFKFEQKDIRLNPYQNLAFRTIGLARDSFKVGLEMAYDSVLKGRSGSRLVRYIAGGVSIPVEDALETEAENGKDIITTLDVFVQEVTENALMKMMVANEAEHGCAIVMETKTGKVKAIANLGKGSDGAYHEDFNYAINPTEPGSTFKLATMIALLEDKKITLNNIVNLEGGTWKINGQTVFDSEQHGRYDVTVKQAFELSSNVGMAKLAYANYGSNPHQFIRHLHQVHMDTITGIDLTGERNSIIYKPGSKYWSATTLPWMAFGYNIAVTPLQTITMYNAVANNGTMMKPFLVKAVTEQGTLIKEMQPKVLIDKICSDATLKQLKECLEGVCIEGTAAKLFKDTPYKVAGKTGTALVANGNKGYADEIYQSSFAGYFPAENPQYTCLVVIKNKPHAIKRHGADVAGPVFKEIADRLYTTRVIQNNSKPNNAKTDSSIFRYAGYKTDVKQVMQSLSVKYKDSSTPANDWTDITAAKGNVTVNNRNIETNKMPSLKGMGLKDAVSICENDLGLRINIKGKGKVTEQSIAAGIPVAKGQVINLYLN